MLQKYRKHLWIFREELVDLIFTIAKLFHRKISNICVSNILRNVNTTTAELQQTKMWNKNGRFKRNLKDKSNLNVFLWLTYCHSEVSRSSDRRYSLRTPFLQNTSRRLLLNIYKKILTNLKNARQTKVQKGFIYGEK